MDAIVVEQKLESLRRCVRRIAHEHLTDFTAFAEVVSRLLPPTSQTTPNR